MAKNNQSTEWAIGTNKNVEGYRNDEKVYPLPPDEIKVIEEDGKQFLEVTVGGVVTKYEEADMFSFVGNGDLSFINNGTIKAYALGNKITASDYSDWKIGYGGVLLDADKTLAAETRVTLIFDWDNARGLNADCIVSDLVIGSRSSEQWEIAETNEDYHYATSSNRFANEIASGHCAFRGLQAQDDTTRQSIENLNTRQITSFYEMFKDSLFDGNLSNWNTAFVLDMTRMFEGATEFKGDGENEGDGESLIWNVTAVEKFNSMFHQATSFNGDLSGWDVEHQEEEPEGWRVGATNWIGRAFCNDGQPRWGTDGTGECDFYIAMSVESKMYPFGDVDDIEIIDTIKIEYHVTNQSRRDKLKLTAFEANSGTWDRDEIYPGEIAIYTTDVPVGYHFIKIVGVDYDSVPPRSIEWEQAGEVAPVFEDEIIIGGEIAPTCIEVIRNNMRTIYCDEHFHKFEVNDFANIQFPTRRIEIMKVDDGDWKFPEDVTADEMRNAKNIEAVFDWDNSEVRANLEWIKTLTQVGGRSPEKVEQPAPGTRAKTPTWIAGQLKRGRYAFNGLSLEKSDAIKNLDISNLSDLGYMFADSTFNDNLNGWDVSGINNMSYTFFGSSWNNGLPAGEDGEIVGSTKNILDWDVSNVLSMRGMFEHNKAFNALIDNWNLSTIRNMDSMFRNASSFNRDLSRWYVLNIRERPVNFDDNAIKWVNVWCNEGRPRWGTEGVEPCQWSGTIDGNLLTFEDWTIIETTGTGGTISLPTAWENCVYLNYNDGSRPVNVKYEVQNGADPETFLTRENDQEYTITAILAWDNETNQSLAWLKDVKEFGKNGAAGNRNQIANGRYAFAGLSVDRLSALTNLDTTNLEDTSHMFANSTQLNQPLNFNMHNVEHAEYMFDGADAFNEDISEWDVSSLGDATGMFRNATSFAGSLVDWDVRELMHMDSMFEGATSFNSEIGAWNTASAEDMSNMFKGATSFHQNLSSWDVENIDEKPEGFDDGATAWAITEVEFNQFGEVITMPSPFMCNYGRPRWGTDGSQFCELDVNTDWTHRPLPTTTGDVKRQFLVRITNASFEDNIKLYSSKDGSPRVQWAEGNSISPNNPLLSPGATAWFMYIADPGQDEISFWAVDEANGGDKDVLSDRVIYQYRSGEITDVDEDFIVEYENGDIWEVRDGFSNRYVTSQYHIVDNVANKEINAPVPNGMEELRAIKVGDYWYFDDEEGATPVGWTYELYPNASPPDEEELAKHPFVKAPLTSGEVKFICDWDNSSSHNDLSWMGNVKQIGYNHSTHTNNTIYNASYAFYKSSTEKIAGINTLSVVNKQSVSHMFADCSLLNEDLYGLDLSQTKDMSYMFANASQFNGNVAGWETQNVESMSNTFKNASNFNQPVDWSTSSVKSLEHMFEGATRFNNILFENIANVERLSGMFKNAKAFNRPLSWNVSNVIAFADMFNGASAFNQDLSAWNVEHITSHVPDFDKDATNWKGTSFCNRGRPRWGVNPTATCLPTASNKAVVKAIGTQTYKIDNASTSAAGFTYYTQFGNAAPVKITNSQSFKITEALSVGGKVHKVLVGEDDSQPGFVPSTAVMIATQVEERAYDNSCVIREYDCNCGGCNCGHHGACGQTCNEYTCNCRDNCWDTTGPSTCQPGCPAGALACHGPCECNWLYQSPDTGNQSWQSYGSPVCPGGWRPCCGCGCVTTTCGAPICDTCRDCQNNHCCLDTCCDKCQEKGKCPTPGGFTDKFGYWFRIENPGSASPVTASVDTFVQQALHGINKNDYKPSSYEKLAAQFKNWVTLNLKGLPSVDGGQDMIVYKNEQTSPSREASKVFVEIYNKDEELVDVDDSQERWYKTGDTIYLRVNEDRQEDGSFGENSEIGFGYKMEIVTDEKITDVFTGTIKELIPSETPGELSTNPNSHPAPKDFLGPRDAAKATYRSRFGFAVKTDEGYDEDSVILMPFDNVILSYKVGKQEFVRDLRTKTSDSLFEYDENGVTLKLTKLPERFEGHVSFVRDNKVVGRAALTDKVIDVDLSSLVV